MAGSCWVIIWKVAIDEGDAMAALLGRAVGRYGRCGGSTAAPC